MHQQMAAALDAVVGGDPARIQRERAERRFTKRPAMADDRAALAQGLDRSRGVDGKQVRGLLARRIRCRWATCDKPGHVAMLEQWMRSYRPEELFDEHGRLDRRNSPRWRPRARGA